MHIFWARLLWAQTNLQMYLQLIDGSAGSCEGLCCVCGCLLHSQCVLTDLAVRVWTNCGFPAWTRRFSDKSTHRCKVLGVTPEGRLTVNFEDGRTTPIDVTKSMLFWDCESNSTRGTSVLKHNVCFRFNMRKYASSMQVIRCFCDTVAIMAMQDALHRLPYMNHSI